MENTLYMLNSVTNIQMNSFIITTEDGKVIVIDGGFRPDAENLLTYLRNITGQERPHVDAWILSHAHLDHILCLMEILEHHPDDVVFDRLMFHFPSVQFIGLEGQESYNIAKEFYRLLPAVADRVEIVSNGDVYDIGQAHIEMLYSPNPELTMNTCNNSSLIFLLSLGKSRVLFLGDAGVEEGDHCLNLYRGTGKLQADYVQMAHHGQNGVEKRFYEEVAPRACLWCTPDWLWNNDAGKGFNTHCFRTVEVRGWMEELGVREHYVMMNGTQEIHL